MKTVQLLKALALGVLVSTALYANDEEPKSKCDLQYDACIEKCDDQYDGSEKCYKKCEKKNDKCLDQEEDDEN